MRFAWVRRLNRGVEVDENLARLRALARAQYAALLENINDPRRPGVTEPEPPLEKRSRRPFFLPDNLETFLDQLLVFLRHVILRDRARQLQFVLHRNVEGWRALRGDEFDQPMNFLVGHKHALGADEPRGARRKVKHVALA